MAKLTDRQLVKRLKRLEALSGIEYDSFTCGIWYDHLKDYDEERFNKLMRIVEMNTKWHIQPTLNDFYNAQSTTLGHW